MLKGKTVVAPSEAEYRKTFPTNQQKKRRRSNKGGKTGGKNSMNAMKTMTTKKVKPAASTTPKGKEDATKEAMVVDAKGEGEAKGEATFCRSWRIMPQSHGQGLTGHF